MRVYLDHNATTPVRTEVREAMLPFLGESWGNPASPHWFGQKALRAVDVARSEVAALIGARPQEIVFTGGGTEADNLALFGFLSTCDGARHRLVTTTIEHPAILEAARELELSGVAVQRIGVDSDGCVDPQEALQALGDDVALISVMLANNDVGSLQPLEEIAKGARARCVGVHTDAVQAVGRIPVDVEALGVDLLSLSAHKLGGPQGVGSLYARAGTRIKPRSLGGAQESSLRAGSLNVPGIVGFGRACALTKSELMLAGSHMITLRNRLERGIFERVPGVFRNGHATKRLPNTVNLGFEGVDGESLLMMLDVLGVATSNGSACTAGSGAPSHVLLAMGLDHARAASTLRFSLGIGTTQEEIDIAVDAVVKAVGTLREVRS